MGFADAHGGFTQLSSNAPPKYAGSPGVTHVSPAAISSERQCNR
jgi:hypothetical protein